MGLRAIFRETLPDVFAAAGEDATFTPIGGTAITCKIFIDFNVLLQPINAEMQVWESGITIEALLSELPRTPDRGDVFTFEGIQYSVKSIILNDGLTIKAVVT